MKKIAFGIAALALPLLLQAPAGSARAFDDGAGQLLAARPDGPEHMLPEPGKKFEGKPGDHSKDWVKDKKDEFKREGQKHREEMKERDKKFREDQKERREGMKDRKKELREKFQDKKDGLKRPERPDLKPNGPDHAPEMPGHRPDGPHIPGAGHRP